MCIRDSYCKVCRFCILREKGDFPILAEYCKRWDGYCASMIELDKVMGSICKVINECYEAVYPNLPKFPKFSFTRAMVTIWKSKVHAKIEPILLEAANNLCLLYTSPSPRDLSTSRMPSSA
eukprot:TRINITY_DN4680_c0_g1_i1.p1 TRINITY_DN4680_c0_g1~~TRINITY_DN4680_c0_g1_i1.p1  ORF type:complete len:121 (+),score=45.07 TRINITY_DN4680_c0_g1_i1:64-426(+)